MPYNELVSQHWIDTRLSVKRLMQQKQWYCGPACAAMVLKYFGTEVKQDEAYQIIHDEKRFQIEQLYSDPRGLVEYINKSNDGTSMFDVSDITMVSAKDAIDNIYRVIHASKMPVIALTQSGGHWVVIEGVRYLDTLDSHRDYVGVYIQNPWGDSTPSLFVEIDEFVDRWITPNIFGNTWLGKIVVLGDIVGIRALGNGTHRSFSALPSSTGMGDEVNATTLMESIGFQKSRPIQGGGAIILKTVEVLDEDTNKIFKIVPIDATNTPEFLDFVYVVVDAEKGRLLEVSNLSMQLDIPTVVESEQLIAASFPGRRISVDRQLYWRNRVGALARTDVYRKFRMDGGPEHYLLRNGSVVEILQIRPVSGG